MNESAQRCEEHINYHLSAILTDTGYALWKCGVVCELCLTGSESCLSGEKKSGLASTGLIFTAAINRRRNPPRED